MDDYDFKRAGTSQMYPTQDDSYAKLDDNDKNDTQMENLIAPSAPKSVYYGEFLAEFIGTFFLVLIIETSTAQNPFSSESAITIQYAVGFGLIVLLYQFAYISGAHYNPCVTIGLHISGHNIMSYSKMCIFFMLQIAGAICGALAGWGLTNKESCAELYITVQDGYQTYQAFFAELAFTFMLLTCIINVAEQKLDFFGIAIGFCLFASIGACAHISGCCLNPAVYIGTILSATMCNADKTSIHYKYFWVYIFAEIMATLIAGWLFKYVFSETQGGSRRRSTYHKVVSTRIQKYLTEFIGTFYLILFIKLCIGEHGYYNPGGNIINPFYHLVTQQSVGCAVVCLLYTYGYIGGAHFNPVVTLVFYMNGHSSMTNLCDFVVYVIVQFIGGTLGGLFAWMIGGDGPGQVYVGTVNEDVFSIPSAFFGEFLFTFLFSIVVANVACKQQGNQFAALAVGFTVFVCIGCAGPISGAALNPAVWFSTYVSAEISFIATGVTSAVTWQYSWIYIVACMSAAWCAGSLHKHLYLPRVEDNNESAIKPSIGDEEDTAERVRRYVGEFIGTFFLILIIKVSIAEDGLSRGSIAQLTIGIGLIILLYLFAWISGAHYNPMVTLGFALAKLGAKEEFNKPNWTQCGIYIIIQILGAIAGGFAAWGIGNEEACQNYIRLPGGFTNARAFGAEFIFTFFLIFVIVNIGVGQGDTQFFGVGIGACLIASIGSIAEISSCCLNPAVWIGTILPAAFCHVTENIGADSKQLWIFVIPETLGTIAAGLLYHYRFSTEEARKSKSNKYMIEFIGAFFWILVVKLAAGHNFDGEDFNSQDPNNIFFTSTYGTYEFDQRGHFYAVSTAVSIGFCLVALVYAFGYISGGHFNPAVTLGLVVRGGLDGFNSTSDAVNVVLYIVSQILGGIAGGFTAWMISNDTLCMNIFPTVDKSNGYTPFQAFGAELLCTFFLITTICHVATKQFGNWFFGMAIGFALFVSVNTIGQISGCAINPAVWLGAIISAATCNDGSADITFGYIWIYVLGTSLGGIFAGLLFRMINDDDSWGSNDVYGDDDMHKYRMSINQSFNANAPRKPTLSSRTNNNLYDSPNIITNHNNLTSNLYDEHALL